MPVTKDEERMLLAQREAWFDDVVALVRRHRTAGTNVGAIIVWMHSLAIEMGKKIGVTEEDAVDMVRRAYRGRTN